MSKPLKNARRTALLLLYAADLSEATDADQLLEDAPQTVVNVPDGPDDPDDLEPIDWDAVARRVTGVLSKRDAIDDEIRQLSPNWRIERMAAVDRNLLRLGIHEILQDLTPALIAINACVELAKEFGTATTPGFINGLLDQLCQDHNITIDGSPRRSG